ncbi:hypothetical protein F5B22DRAFT_643488 [Xylaria bambusicola]|uniref:uncharacterized protein n=1 Tax=Xylaria bambusicola TaxID=326684 RepID=UPI002007384C|nr:uncharacterized protein F5B22DRAFT_643488 [Xylaria bambusicola]KAI0521907.1 hypothetical protein F5B22DRAFT_643488 [Xylaria bambusicola]
MAFPLQAQQPIPPLQFLQLDDPQNENVDSRPFSPWAARFGITDTDQDAVFDRAPEQKSGVAPDHSTTHAICLISPFIHSIYYDDPLETKDQGVFSGQDDIDRFFFAETKYRGRFENIAPWQLGPQNRVVRFSRRGYVPGGNIRSLVQPKVTTIHAAIFGTERIEVNEDRWFKCFRKDRWWGSVASPKDQREFLVEGDRWSVDEPRAWYWISMVIELVDRMLKALVKDKHPFLETILYGKLTYWNDPEYIQAAPSAEPQPEAKVLLSRAFMKQRWQAENGDAPFNWDTILDKYDESMWTARIEHLSSDQQWAFLPPTDADDDVYAGVTDPTRGGLICLNSIRLRALMNNRYTLAERCNAIVAQADTMVHELAHGLVHRRIKHDTDQFFTTLNPYNDDWLQFPRMNSEPFVDYGGSAEMGYALEKVMFGGPIRIVGLKGEQEPMLGIHKLSWPFPDYGGQGGLGRTASGHPAYQDGVDNTLTLVTSLWTSKLLSEEFWKDDTIPRKSDNFFHSIDFFRSEHPYYAATFSKSSRPSPMIMDRETITELREQGQLDEGLADVISDWELRESLYNQARAGWYDQERQKWLNSPWANLEARKRFHIFDAEMKRTFVNRRLYHCAFNAHWLMSTIPWGSRVQYTTCLHQKEKLWPWHAVGLLMMAAIPLRPIDFTTKPLLRLIQETLYPSSENPTSKPVWKYLRGPALGDPNATEWTPPSVFSDPLGRDGQIFFFGQYTHIDFLDQVKKLVRYFADKEMPVSKPWIDELLRVEARIREQRQQQQRGMASPLDNALAYADTAWDFKIPKYDPNEKWWSSTADGWVDL